MRFLFVCWGFFDGKKKNKKKSPQRININLYVFISSSSSEWRQLTCDWLHCLSHVIISVWLNHFQWILSRRKMCGCMNHSMHQKQLTSLIVRQVLPFERVPLCRLLTSLLAVTWLGSFLWERRKREENWISHRFSSSSCHAGGMDEKEKNYLSLRSRHASDERKKGGRKWAKKMNIFLDDIVGNSRFFISKKCELIIIISRVQPGKRVRDISKKKVRYL